MRNLNLVLPLAGLLCVVSAGVAQTTPPTCAVTAVPTLVRAEGIAEQLGDIVISCSGFAPGQTITTNLTLQYNTLITNRRAASGTIDAQLQIDSGAGLQPSPIAPRLDSVNRFTFAGLALANTTGTGQVSLRVTNVRGRALLQTGPFPTPIIATLATQGIGALALNTAVITVGTSSTGLLGSVLGTIITTPPGSPVPADQSFAGFRSGTRYVTGRVTEGFATAFGSQQTASAGILTPGTRILARYAGLPAGTRLFVPDVLVGTGGILPTSAGDFGLEPSAGSFDLAQQPLVLVRVRGANAAGAGGFLSSLNAAPGTTTVLPGTMSEVESVNSTAQAVYEVVSTNPSVRESVQVPTFVTFPASPAGVTARPTLTFAFGPLETAGETLETAPIPRFTAPTAALPNDCQAVGDCNAAYQPVLRVGGQGLTFTSPSTAESIIRYFDIGNAGGSTLFFTVSLAYKSGANWIMIQGGPDTQGWIRPGSPDTVIVGTRATGLRVDLLPQALTQPGTYEATITIDAGPAGIATLPVSLTIVTSLPGPTPPNPNPNPPPTPPVVQLPVVSNVVNAANNREDGLAAGVIATVYGQRYGTSGVTVTFDGLPARVLFANDTQLNVVVPAELGTRGAANIVVTAGGVASTARTVTLASVAPAIFPAGVVNADNRANTDANPAPVGSVLVVYGTGLLSPAGGRITAIIHDREIAQPIYADAAPGLVGVQQVNFTIPADLPAMTTEVRLCSTVGTQPRVCSLPAQVRLSRPAQ